MAFPEWQVPPSLPPNQAAADAVQPHSAPIVSGGQVRAYIQKWRGSPRTTRYACSRPSPRKPQRSSTPAEAAFESSTVAWMRAKPSVSSAQPVKAAHAFVARPWRQCAGAMS
ncbi:hypothetical protein D9M68_860270 [compost metagenome]